MKVHSVFPKAPALQEPHHQIVWCPVNTLFAGIVPLCRGAVDRFYSPSRLGSEDRQQHNNDCSGLHFVQLLTGKIIYEAIIFGKENLFPHEDFLFNENWFSFIVADHLLVGQLCTNPKSDRSLLSCLKVTQCSTSEIGDAPLYNSCSLPIQVMTTGPWPAPS